MNLYMPKEIWEKLSAKTKKEFELKLEKNKLGDRVKYKEDEINMMNSFRIGVYPSVEISRNNQQLDLKLISGQEYCDMMNKLSVFLDLIEKERDLDAEKNRLRKLTDSVKNMKEFLNEVK